MKDLIIVNSSDVTAHVHIALKEYQVTGDLYLQVT